MPAVFADQIVTEFYNGSAWVDLSAYVVGDMRGLNGLGGWQPERRVAVLGSLNLTLNNKAKLFSPMGGDTLRSLNTLSGFTKGARIRIRIVLNDQTWVIWTGRIAQLDSDDKNWGNEQTRLIAFDWMEVPTNYPMKGAAIALDQTIDSAIALILARLSIQPDATDLDAGHYIFPAVFDNVRNRSMASGELTKLAYSELGYIYMKGDGTLRAENATARAGQRALDVAELHPDDYSFLLKEDGDHLLTESGDLIILDDAQAVALYADVEAHNILLDPNSLLNAAIIRGYPTITDTSLKVLFTLRSPLYIPGKSTATFSAHYVDPNGYSQIAGTNMQTPAATTDYLANTLSDGTGTNRTSDLQVTAAYYGDGVDYSLYNNNSAGIWVTFLQARGYGIYYGNSIESRLDDETSQDAYGYQVFQFDQRYQRDTYAARAYGASVIEEYKTPKSRITQMSYLANLNSNHFMSFLSLDVGSLIRITEDRSGIDAHYYVTDRAFTIRQGGIISVSYGLKENDSYLSGGLSPLTIDMHHRGTNGNVDYGFLPLCAGLSKRTIAGWVYARDVITGAILSTLTPDGGEGWQLAIGGTDQAEWYQKHPNGTLGTWLTPASGLALNTWYHIVMTHDRALNADAAPEIWINGTKQSLTVASAPAGTSIEDEYGLTLHLGGVHGMLRDVREYDRILTDAEIATLYNAGVPDESLVTEGLVFQAPAVYADRGDVTSLDGTGLLASDRLIENAFRAVGTPSGDVMIGDQGALMAWATHASSGAGALYAVYYSPELGLFAAGGAITGTTGCIQTSPDGVTWTIRTSANAGSVWAITWVASLGLFVAIGFNTLWTSADGITWSAGTPPTTDGAEAIAWSPALQLFVAVGSSDGTHGAIYTSPNGTAWTARITNLAQILYGVAWSPALGLFVATGIHQVLTSADGIVWEARTCPARSWASVAWSAELGLFVAIAQQHYSMISADGILWEDIDMLTSSGSWNEIAWSSALRMFVVMASSGTARAAISLDGRTWYQVTPGADNDWWGICAADALAAVVAVGSSGDRTTKLS